MIIGIDASRGFERNRGGPEYYTYHLIKNISKLDKVNKYILYVRKKQGDKIDFPLPDNFRVEEINLPYLWTQVGLAKKTIFGNLDLLFVPAHTLPVITRLLRPKLPIVVTIHGLEGKFLPNSEKFYTHIYRNWSITWSIRLATHLISVSNYTKEEILKHYKISRNKITVIYEGVDDRFFRNYSKNEKNKTAKVLKKYRIKNPYILFVGTVQPRKNLIRLIAAFSAAREKLHTKYNKIELIIAGKLGWLYHNITKAPKRYQVEEFVKFVGRVDDDDLPYLYFAADCFILPSITEGFGLPVLEAQAAGVPTIVTRQGAPAEIARSAVLVDPQSSESIENGIVKLLSDKTLQQRLIREGRRNAKKMSWSKTAYSTINLLRRIGDKNS